MNPAGAVFLLWVGGARESRTRSVVSEETAPWAEALPRGAQSRGGKQDIIGQIDGVGGEDADGWKA